jgi:hypothetical protein
MGKVTEIWRELLIEFDVEKSHFVWEHEPILTQKIFEYVNSESVGVTEFESCIQDILNRSREEHAHEPIGEAILSVLNKLMYHLTPERQLLFVRAGLRRLAEEFYLPAPQWSLLWSFFVANKIGIRNLVQVRQLRSLATKLVATNIPRYHDNTFMVDQLILIPKIMRMSRLERIKWFHEIRKPKWLTQ